MKNINQQKKILLIFAESSVKSKKADADLLAKELTSAAQADQKNIEIYITYARDLSYYLDGHQTRIYDHCNNTDLKDYDLVYFRKAGTIMQQMLSCAVYLRKHNVPYFDREIGSANSRNKLSQMFLMWEAGLPVPKTLFTRSRKRLLTILEEVVTSKNFAFPVIAKATGGTRGDANYLVYNLDEMARLLETEKRHFIIQEFIPNDGDYRVLVMNQKVRGLIGRRAAPGTHLNNTSQDGSADWLPVNTLSEKVLYDSVRAAQLFGRDVAGVDAIIDKNTGSHYFLEVNRAPQIENASFPRQKASILIEAIDEAINEYEPQNLYEGGDVVVFGRKEKLAIKELPELETFVAKVDSGAYHCSLDCPFVEEVEKNGEKILRYSPLSDQSKAHETKNYYKKTVTSSNGISEERYVVELTLLMGGQKYKAQVSLANRSAMKYRFLIGRKFLRQNHILINVRQRLSLEG